ncbi:MAG: thioredoxin family protein [Dehalococcoidia bacterium]|nr:thioredoxin family protein [Dehalococcoidia bacterium]MCB9491940.1 thioredoxin family protein [Dehalococcoidia bacterium]
MLERLLIATVVLAIVLVAIAAGRRWYAWRNARIEDRLRAEARAVSADTASEDAPTAPGGPRIVYFTTKTCVVCKAQQEPAIAAVREHLGDGLRIERHDAVEERALADRYGVLTVPTTAVYDAGGELVTVNRGFAPAAVLLSQLRGEVPSFEGGALMSSERLDERSA